MGQVSSSQAREFDDEFPQHTAGHLPIDGIDVEHHGDGRYTSPDSLTDRVREMVSGISTTSLRGDDDGDSKTTEETVPTVFSWAHGGDEVFITGTFNNWSAKIPMHRSHDDFSLILDVPSGAHQYKFIVDGDWRYAPDQATVADSHGVVNNTITVSSTKNDATFQVDDGGDSVTYGQAMPHSSEYSGKEPPQLPPHLRFIPLNSTDNLSDPVAMPVPYHVTLNHVYGSGKKDSDVLVLGFTSRYKNKFVTTVYYKPSNRRIQSDVEELDPVSRVTRHRSEPLGLTAPMSRMRMLDDRVGRTPVAETKEAFFDM